MSFSNHILNSCWWIPVSERFCSPEWWSPFWMLVYSLLFILKMTLLNPILKSWLTSPMVDGTVRCQGSLLCGTCERSLTGTSFCSSYLIPLAFWKLSWLPSQHAALAFFSQDPISSVLPPWHSTEPKKWSSFCLYITKLRIFPVALNLRKNVPLFRTQPTPHLLPEALWDLSNPRGSGLPCAPTVQLVLGHCPLLLLHWFS